MEVTITILVITCVVSFMAFSNQAIVDKLIFYPPAINKQKEWYRFFTCGLIHADIAHLAFNMFSFYLFGKLVEQEFRIIFPGIGTFLYVTLYVSALAICLLPTYSKHKDNYYYKSLGASGAVSAVVFAGILLFPTSKIGLLVIPPIIPAFIFAPIYLIITAYLDKKGDSGINHSAHLWGALYGLAFLIVTSYFLSEFRPLESFVEQVTDYFR
ncbi:rhomboid family intramembrane serine protease [Panacibacter ginsenosidivorans]|uniref:Rhomboid family intramembrane serine protease n=1 Tax=Panacibacter ginsenosidivorans TaxID=1813871 RepID=A0A5B8V9A7_9BACT|nr:rhomboid family intramembrane serine protease [Panacibacter ginsenosidivorans]QEC66938.1 rhomboid family intramembrane serine protease [Panacibacter ginsenosidivorans]